jgi:glycosyltransferase involved in cell wall biosynthesis
MSIGNGILFSKPAIIDGELHRGVVSIENELATLPRIKRDVWVILHCQHGAAPPSTHPEVDLCQVDQFFSQWCRTKPYVLAIPRDFVDPDDYRPLPDIDKQYDIVVNATWLPVKRHELLLKALKHAMDAGRPITCLCYGYHWHPSGPAIEQQVKTGARRLRLPITFLDTDWDPAENNRRYNKCRVAFLCSKSEAGPRVMSEAMLAGLPYVTTVDTYGGSVAYIGAQNGELAPPTPDGIAKTLWRTLDRMTTYAPREWALANMSRPVANARLTEALRRLAVARQWKIHIPEFTYKGDLAPEWLERVEAAQEEISAG